MVAFLDKEVEDKFEFPCEIELTNKLNNVIDFTDKVDSKYYYKEDSCTFYATLKAAVTRPDTVYQWRRVYVRENKSNLCPTLIANMGTGGHNVPLIYTAHGIRKLTPRECFKLQGFGEDLNIPAHISNAQLYKQAGNSVVVSVIERIALNIYNALS